MLSGPLEDIQTLPPEILSQIMLRAQAYDVQIPWTLSWVDRSFRHLAIGTPTLWSNIDIMHGERRVALSLERCGTTLLDVTASLPPIILHQADNRDLIRSFMNKVSPLAGRIRSLRMVYTSSSYLETAVSLIPTFLPALESMDIGIVNLVGALAVGGLPAHLREKMVACRPTNLSLRGNPVWAVQEDLFSRVTAFEYRAPSCKEPDRKIGRVHFLNWLRKMPHLQILVLEDAHHLVEGLGEAWSEEEEPITLSELREVRLDGLLGRDLLGLWAKIDTPSLEAVTIQFKDSLPHPTWSQYSDDPCSDWLLMLVERNPQLLELDITDCHIFDSKWGELFRKSPSLLRLRIASCDLSWGLADALEPGTPPAALACPKLQYLVVDNEFDMTSFPLRSVVEKRKESSLGVSPIRWLVVRGAASGNMGRADVRWLSRSVEELLIECLDTDLADKEGYDGRGDWKSERDNEVSDLEPGDSDTESLVSGDLDVIRGLEDGMRRLPYSLLQVALTRFALVTSRWDNGL